MKPGLLAMSVLLLTSCNQGTADSAPLETDVARLEAKLARHPCVGNLEDWERNYRFAKQEGFLWGYSIDPASDIIEFHLRRIGTVTIEPGIKVISPAQSEDWPEIPTVRSVDGTFGIVGGRLNVSRCKPALKN